MHQQLRSALLAEMAAGHYRDGDRFLSNRKICRLWSVSPTTTTKALHWLVANNLLRPHSRSSYRLGRRHQVKALLQLHQSPGVAPLQPRSWASRMIGKLGHPPANDPSARHRIALITEGGPFFQYPSVTVHGASALPTSKHDQRDLAAGFFESAVKARDQVEHYIYTDAPEELDALLRKLDEAHCDAAVVIIRKARSKRHPLVEAINASGRKLLLVFDDANSRTTPVLTVNNIGVGYEAVNRLIDLGHRKIAVLATIASNRYMNLRVQGAQLARVEAGRDDLSFEVIKFSHLERYPLPQSVRRLFLDPSRRPTAIITTTHQLVNKMRPVLREARLTPGKNFSVLICGARRAFKGFRCEFDCMSIDFTKVGREAHKMVAELIDGTLTERSRLVSAHYERGNSLVPAVPSCGSGLRNR